MSNYDFVVNDALGSTQLNSTTYDLSILGQSPTKSDNKRFIQSLPSYIKDPKKEIFTIGALMSVGDVVGGSHFEPGIRYGSGESDVFVTPISAAENIIFLGFASDIPAVRDDYGIVVNDAYNKYLYNSKYKSVKIIKRVIIPDIDYKGRIPTPVINFDKNITKIAVVVNQVYTRALGFINGAPHSGITTISFSGQGELTFATRFIGGLGPYLDPTYAKTISDTIDILILDCSHL